MKRYWVEYHEEPVSSPMTYWVHGNPGEAETNPDLQPLPLPVPGRGFLQVFVEVDDFVFEFISGAEILQCSTVLGRKLLPTTTQLSKNRGTGVGPNSHWLSRLPKRVKKWRYREKAITFLDQIVAKLESGNLHEVEKTKK